MLKIENITSIEDFEDYIDGCLNDFEHFLSTREETKLYLLELFSHFLNKAGVVISGNEPKEGQSEEIEIVEIKSAIEHLALIKRAIKEGKLSKYITDPIMDVILEGSLKFVFDTLKKKVTYKKDIGLDQKKIYKVVDNYFERGEADIDGLLILLGSILKEMQISFSIRLVNFKKDIPFQHGFIIVPKRKGIDIRKRQNYFAMDLTQEEFNKEPQYIDHENFSVL